MPTFVRRFLPLVLAAIAFGQTPLTNETIIKMVKAGLGEDVIISTITSQPAKYSTAPDDLIALKGANVSDRVIGVMVERRWRSTAPLLRQRPLLPRRLPAPLRLRSMKSASTS